MLTREVFQAERAASRQCRVEADRLEDRLPARLLLDVARHAEASSAELPALVKAAGLPKTRIGQALGSSLSLFRDAFSDLLLDRERSYRATLLGMHHGLDLVRLYRDVARRLPEGAALANFCDGWLEERELLVDACADGLVWFADHPDEAMAPAARLPLLHTYQARAEWKRLAG